MHLGQYKENVSYSELFETLREVRITSAISRDSERLIEHKSKKNRVDEYRHILLNMRCNGTHGKIGTGPQKLSFVGRCVNRLT